MKESRYLGESESLMITRIGQLELSINSYKADEYKIYHYIGKRDEL